MYNTERFDYNKNKLMLTAWASDLMFVPSNTIMLISQWTGKSAEFHKWTTHRDSEGDVCWWDYMSDESRATVRVYND